MFDPQEIRERITTAYPQASVEVKDLTGGKDHFEVSVKAAEFSGMTPIQRHRAVYALFEAEVGGPIHALSLKLSGR